MSPEPGPYWGWAAKKLLEKPSLVERGARRPWLWVLVVAIIAAVAIGIAWNV